MGYCFHKETDLSFALAVDKARALLAAEGFGVLTEIDVKATLKKKLNEDFPEYLILGACNPPFARKALRAEERIGVMLPCNVVVRVRPDGKTEVAAIDPESAMKAVGNQGLGEVAAAIAAKLRKVVDGV